MGDIHNISCSYKEYRLINNKWVNTESINYLTDGKAIERMIESGYYFTKLGGHMTVDYKNNRRFVVVPVKVVSVSICGMIKKILRLSYNQAQF